MKKVDNDEIDELPGIPIEGNDTFYFRCHPDVSCFNRCCRNLNLFLYPYDVVRLKQCLGITSDEFLDKYVNVVLIPANFFTGSASANVADTGENLSLFDRFGVLRLSGPTGYLQNISD